MNLKEAKKRNKLPQFAKEHEVKDPHPQGKERFDVLLDAMAQGKKTSRAKTSTSVPSADYGGTRTRRGSSGGTSG